MNLLFLFLLSSFILTLNVSAKETNYIDKTYNAISEKVIDYSNSIDNTIFGLLVNSEENTSSSQDIIEKSPDTFFHNDKFVEETRETFISVGLSYDLNSLTHQKFSLSVNARLPLSKSTKKYNLFINDLTKDNVNSVIGRNSRSEQTRPEIGINYFTILLDDIKSKYSLGTNGINPFTIARYSVSRNFKTWKIEPTQRFKYSLKDEFEEETNIYFDKKTSESTLFRTILHRATQTDSSGMDYSIAFQEYWTYPNKIGLLLSQSFSGNTEYEYTNSVGLKKKDRGITSYTTSFSYRQSIWRKWFYYSITPSVNFNKENDYEVSYNLNLFTQFYFGHIK